MVMMMVYGYYFTIRMKNIIIDSLRCKIKIIRGHFANFRLKMGMRSLRWQKLVKDMTLLQHTKSPSELWEKTSRYFLMVSKSFLCKIIIIFPAVSVFSRMLSSLCLIMSRCSGYRSSRLNIEAVDIKAHFGENVNLRSIKRIEAR